MKFSLDSLFLTQKSKEILDRRKLKDANLGSTEKAIKDRDFFVAKKSDNNDKKIEQISRRDFLRTGANVGAMVGMSGILENDLIIKAAEKILNDDKGEQIDDSDDEMMDEESVKMAEDDARPIRELINYHTPGRIDLTGINTQEILKNYWKKRHKEDHDLRNSLEKAFYEMGAYDRRLRRIFEKVGVPEKYRYVAIPESYWNMNAHSGSGAVGPYQFMAETAKRHGLSTDYNNDQRKDPLRSAWACAQELKYLYGKTKDWDLSLSGFNGGLIWGYLHKDNKKNPNVTPYEDFLAYIEERINATRDMIRSEKYRQYRVAKNDTVDGIAKKFNKKREEITVANGIKNNKIRLGQVLEIPYSEAEKEKDFNVAIKKAGYFENLTYPAKFNAVNELIEEKFVYAQRKPIDIQEHKVAILEPKPHETKTSKTKKA